MERNQSFFQVNSLTILFPSFRGVWYLFEHLDAFDVVIKYQLNTKMQLWKLEKYWNYLNFCKKNTLLKSNSLKELK